MNKPKSTKKAAKATTPKPTTDTPKEPVVVTSATKKAAKKAAAKEPREKAPKQELCVFALRMTAEERDSLHAAAGPAKASKFARALLVAAARNDRALIDTILKGVESVEK